MEKLIFDYNNFCEINYLNFDLNFKIALDDKIGIILGPNGTGKTSIYSNIKSRHQDYSYIDYRDVEQSVIASKNKIIIGASILKIWKNEPQRTNLYFIRKNTYCGGQKNGYKIRPPEESNTL